MMWKKKLKIRNAKFKMENKKMRTKKFGKS